MNATVWDRAVRTAAASDPACDGLQRLDREGRLPLRGRDRGVGGLRPRPGPGASRPDGGRSSRRSWRAWHRVRDADRSRGPDLDRFEDVHSAVEILLIEDDRRGGQEAPYGPQPERTGGHGRAALSEGPARPRILGRIAAVQAGLLRLAERHPEASSCRATPISSRGQCVLFAHYILSFFWPLERGQGPARGRPEEDRRPAPGLGRPGRVHRRPRPGLPRGDPRIRGPCHENSLRRRLRPELHPGDALRPGPRPPRPRAGSAEDFVIFSSAEFGFLELDDAIATSSSLMPQKKNPDIFELIRAGPARLFGGPEPAVHGRQGPALVLQQGPPGGQGARCAAASRTPPTSSTRRSPP